MFIESRSLPGDEIIETDICIVGGGPAGIILALELAKSNLKVVLMESGGMDFEDETQELYDGPLLGFQYDPLDEARLRFLGGSSNHWAGNCMPLEAIDFEERSWMAYSGWPISRADLDPYYLRAQPYFELETDYAYDFERWAEHIGKPALQLNTENLVNLSVNTSPPTAFGYTYEDALAASDNITVYLNANAVDIGTNDRASKVTHINFSCIDGPNFIVKAKRYALCMGGIETPRLLLTSNNVAPAGLGNNNDLVGRFFGDHPAIRPIMRVLLKDDIEQLALYTDSHSVDGFGFIGAVASSDALLRREQIGGFRFHLFETQASPGELSVRALLKGVSGQEDVPYLSSQIANVLTDMDGITNRIYKKVTGGDEGIIDRSWIGPWLAIECVPNPDSRVMLVDEKDRFGNRKVGLDWQLTDQDMRTFQRATQIMAQEVGRLGLGRAWSDALREDYDWPPFVARGKHHCGTARMSSSPKTGVVDADCRVHEVSNLYIGGSAVFPTHGFATPTLTIGALSIRMADKFISDAKQGAL